MNYTITCTKNYGKHWAVGDAFGADSAKFEDGKIKGKDVDGKSFSLPREKFSITQHYR